MSVDYDLVIIGGSHAGVYAATAAASLNARTALVVDRWQVATSSYHHAVSQVGRVLHQHRHGDHWGISKPIETAETQSITAEWQPTLHWADAITATIQEPYSPAILASLGIDVIEGSGAFVSRPRLAFEVNQRRLRSRAFLLTPPTRPIVPDIPGLQETGFLTPDTLRSSATEGDRPERLVVVGGDPAGIELAQTFARFGSQVTLVLKGAHLLPREDPEAADQIRAHLEAEGVRVLTQMPVMQVRWLEGKKWVQAGNRAIETDEILLAAGQYPDLAALNLESVGVRRDRYGLYLNNKLQTTHPKIFACGTSIGGRSFPHVSTYEAKVAVKNALFLPILRADYRAIPRACLTSPELASIGLTEPQARERYGKDVLVVRQSFTASAQAQITGETAGFCKLVARENGDLLGAHLVGASASELIGTIALALQHRLKVSALANLTVASPTLAEILSNTAIEWQQQRRRNNTRLQDFLENLFKLRRSWSS